MMSNRYTMSCVQVMYNRNISCTWTQKSMCVSITCKHLIETWRHKSTVHVHVHLCLCYRNTHVQV